MTSRVKKTQPPAAMFFLLIQTIIKLILRIQETNVRTKCHEDWTKNVTSTVFTCFHNIHIEKTAPPPGGHVFSPIWTIFFHDDWAKIVTSRVFTRNTSSPPGGHVFQRTGTIFELNQHIIKTSILTKLHEDWASNVTSTMFTSFELSQGIIGINVLTKFHEDRTRNEASSVHKAKCELKTNVQTKFHKDWTINVTPRVLTSKTSLPSFTCFHYIHLEKSALPSGGHVFSPIWTIFELVQDINETNVLTKFHDDWAKIVTSRVFTRITAPTPSGHVFQWTETIFELNQHIIKTNILTKLHEDLASNVTSTVFTRRGIIMANVLTKFHEDRTINVASSVHKANVDDGRTTDKRRSQ
ncbi:hypothetical protein DPMN_117224 [Dreissena polymorpha]|uniref:Uncharacterized protein n=1 Tax=Dreissena polymorpha TaxID=45954 RepID=A0A9D4KPZ9_DREPO|nr:hypothetical protein DPMN_117224 [Dreissena polymorpha]